MAAWRVALCGMLFLSGGPVLAADLRSDAETLLRRMAVDPEAAYVVQSAAQASFTEQGDEVTIKIAALALAPRINAKAGIAIGDVLIHVHRRPDGGVEASADLPNRITLRGATPPAPSQLGVEQGKLVLGWDADLESDRIAFSAASIAVIGADDKPTALVSGPSFSTDRTAAKGGDGRFAVSIGAIQDLHNQAPVSVQGLGPFMIEGHYTDFPRDRLRLLLHHLMLWEQMRASRNDLSAGLGGLEQGMALLAEAQTHYVIDKMLLRVGESWLQAESDLHFSLEAANGVIGSATAWFVETKKEGAVEAPNPAMSLGTQLARQFGAPGKAPDGSEARLFHIELAADGNATLNGEPAPGLATGISTTFKAFAQGWAGTRAAAPSQTIPGASGCGTPIYPQEALAAEESGHTVLTFDYDETGKVTMTRIQTSGFARLDEAARAAYISCKFPPGIASAVIPVVWRIENGRGTASIGVGLTTTSK